jgi:hypothetical protein
VDLLVRAGAKVDAANPEGITPLAMACLYGNVSMINKLIKAGADAAQRGPNGQTLLMLAARNGQPEAINILAAAGADVNAKESLRGTTALMWAAEQKHPAAGRTSDPGWWCRRCAAGRPETLAGRVNAAAVQAAVRRRAAAAAAGRTYEEQLDFEGVNGRFGAPGGAGAAQPQAAGGRGQAGGRGGAGRGAGTAAAAPASAAAPAQAAAPAPEAAEANDDSEVVGRPVGFAGGDALVFAAREGDSAPSTCFERARWNQTT